jgi:hypothetical protein
VRKLIITPTIAVLVLAGTAAAAAPGTVTATLNPNVAKRASTLQITGTGPFSGTSGLPQSLVIDVQRGFSTSTKSVKEECTVQQEKASPPACPKDSEIGHGTIQLTANLGVSQIPTTAAMTLYLGQSVQHGDIASVELVITDQYLSQPYSATGRLYHVAGGGLEIKFANFSAPTLPVPPSAVTVNNVYMTIGASTTVTKKVKTGSGKHRRTVRKKVVYSLITNPATCHGTWTGSFAMTLQNGSIKQALSVPCRKR